MLPERASMTTESHQKDHSVVPNRYDLMDSDRSNPTLHLASERKLSKLMRDKLEMLKILVCF